MNAKVVGVSVDSLFAQGAWAKQNNIGFPLAADYEHKVTQAYDVVWPNFAGMGPGAARAVFVLDGQGVIRYVEVTENPGVQVNFEAAKAALASLAQTATA
jgi:peroxiredoxin